MNCKICGKKAAVSTPFGEKHYCDKHFLESIEKRIRKNIRINNPLDIRKSYSIKAQSEEHKILANKVLDRIFKGRLKITGKSKNIILAKSLDLEAENFMEDFFKGRKSNQNQFPNIFGSVIEKELHEIARILKIRLKSRKDKTFLGKLEKMYPGTLFSVSKSRDFVIKKIKK